jgi:predicted short-subunit dehydrogenase-like oxidoreductase (DUF2520 family)
MQKKEISIIGTGALGGMLAKALSLLGITIAGLYNRSAESLHVLNDEIKAHTTGSFPASVSAIGEVCFITVSDENIQEIAERLSSVSDDFTGRLIVHCSGSKTSAKLSSLQQKGALVASFHPLQTFTASSSPEDLSGIYFDVEGDKEAVDFLKQLAEILGSSCIEIDPKAKPYLHAAAVMSSNYLVALIELSSKIAAMGGLEKAEARKALLPLMQQSLQNSSDSAFLSDALSGPIARGDASTVEKHIELLEQNPQLLALYKQLGLAALDLAIAGNKISETQQEKLLQLLN